MAQRIGLFVDTQDLDEHVSRVREAHEAGFASAWAPQVFGLDALTALAVAGREVPEIELGTAVVPTYPRHPQMLAAQALTTQAASSGRLTLGIGLSHQVVVENMWGISFEKPARHMQEYLSALMPLLRDKTVAFKGETVTAMGQLQVGTDVPAPTVVVAALGPRMLKLAGSLADGTITWMTGPKTVSSHIAPSISAAADEAGKPAPRVVVALPVVVTSDEQAAREKAGRFFQMYGHLPSYRAMLDREGAEPADVGIIGDAAAVRAGIEGVFAAGATDFVAYPFTERDATLEVLQGLL